MKKFYNDNFLDNRCFGLALTVNFDIICAAGNGNILFIDTRDHDNDALNLTGFFSYNYGGPGLETVTKMYPIQIMPHFTEANHVLTINRFVTSGGQYFKVCAYTNMSAQAAPLDQDNPIDMSPLQSGDHPFKCHPTQMPLISNGQEPKMTRSTVDKNEFIVLY
jgi:hypothetical protein